MKTGRTRLKVLIDRSGSMEAVRDATIAGINEFIVSQKSEPGEATIQIVQFDEDRRAFSYAVILDKKLSDVTPITRDQFQPRGMTPLFDAIGKAIGDLGDELRALKEEERPEKVIVCIVTDGFENASHNFTVDKVKEMVEHQTKTYNWKFTYVGANQDAILVAQTFGIDGLCAMTYTADSTHVKQAFRGMSAMASRVRSANIAEVNNIGYTTAERKASVKDNDPTTEKMEAPDA